MDIITVVSTFEHHKKLIISIFAQFARDLFEKQILLVQRDGRIHKSYLIRLLKMSNALPAIGIRRKHD